MIDIIVAIVSGLLFGTGVLLLYDLHDGTKRVSLKQRLKSQVSKVLKKKSMHDDEESNIVKGTHFYISINHYNAIRSVISAVILLFGWLDKSFILFACLFFLLSWPRDTIWVVRLPFYYFCKMVSDIDKEKKDIELMDVLSLLKNLMIQMRNNPLGSDYIIDYITENTDLTKSAFLKLLNLMRLSRHRDAAETFENEIRTPLAKDVSRIILRLDDLNPAELEEMVISVQRQVQEMKITKQDSRNELVSDLTMIPTTATMMFIFFNFMYVAFGIDQLQQLRMIFNY